MSSILKHAEKIDSIVIGQSEILRYEDYSKLPVDRIDLYRDLVFLRMVHLNGRFTSHLDVMNLVRSGKVFSEASDRERRELLSIWNLPGMSSLLVANSARHEGFNVKVINNFDAEWDRFVEFYDSQPQPPLVGISTTFYLGYAEVKRLARRLRAHDPNMKIVAGGAFTNEQTINSTIEAFETPMRKYGLDYVLHAFNSDEDFPALLRAHQRGDGYDQVPNLTYFDRSGAFRATPKVWRNPTLNSKPMLWREIDLSFANRTIQLRAASGCPFSCAFCSYPETAGGHFAMELELIERQLRDIESLGFVERIIFIDDTFNVPIRRFEQILKILLKFHFEWFSFLRVQYVTEEIARMMKESGCHGVYLGVESSNDVILKNMNKKATREGFLRGIELLNKYGIPTFVAFVVGFPGETQQTIDENIAFLGQCDVDFYSTKEFYYMPHTSVHQDRDKYGLTGMGNKWSHKTMDSQTAADMKTYMFRNVKNSVFIDPDTSLWYLAYLYDQGFSFDQIKACQRIMNEMMLDEIEGRFDGKEQHLARLERALAMPYSPEAVRRAARLSETAAGSVASAQ
jgi:anaerobic magnesium-protoporphyrin IX monomethyl ester cyclase